MLSILAAGARIRKHGRCAEEEFVHQNVQPLQRPDRTCSGTVSYALEENHFSAFDIATSDPFTPSIAPSSSLQTSRVAVELLGLRNPFSDAGSNMGSAELRRKPVRAYGV